MLNGISRRRCESRRRLDEEATAKRAAKTLTYMKSRSGPFPRDLFERDHHKNCVSRSASWHFSSAVNVAGNQPGRAQVR